MNDNTAPIASADLAAELGLSEAEVISYGARLGLRRGRRREYSAEYAARIRVAVAAGHPRREQRLAAHRPTGDATSPPPRIAARTLATELGVSAQAIYTRAQTLGFAPDGLGFTPDQAAALRGYTPRRPGRAGRGAGEAPPSPVRTAILTAGMTIPALAAATGLTPNAIRARARALGIGARGQREYTVDEARALCAAPSRLGHPRALTAAQEAEVREQYRIGRYTRRELAAHYNVSLGAIKYALSGMTVDAPAHGTINRRGGSRLTAPLVRTIRQRLAGGETQSAIAADLGVSVSTISRIASGKAWADLDASPPIGDVGIPSPDAPP